LASDPPAPAADGATSQALRKIAIAYSGVSPSQSPIWITYESGFFRKYGLDVQMIFIESGSRTVQTLVSGDVAAAQVAGAPVIQSNLQGSGVVMIAGLLNTLDYKLVVARDITRPDQLKGKTMAVSRAGGSSDFATRYALEKYGLIPGKDVTLVQIGSQPARFAALETGKIHGVMISIPLTANAAKSGFITLADLQMLGLEYQHTSLALNQNFLKKQPEVGRSILKAFVEGIHYMKTRRRETLSILARYLKTEDQDALEEAYEAIILALIPQKPYPTIKGIQTILREFGAKDELARGARPEQFVDMTFMRELDSSGFIDRLYKSSVVAKTTPTPDPPPTAVREPSERIAVKTKLPTAEEKAKAPPPSVEKPPPAPRVAMSTLAAGRSQQHVVKLGDTLSKIAGQYYDSILEWERIYDANKGIVKNPHFIYIGMKLVIPPFDSSGG
jgi:ABC-type nitrate/sulfonate/bicarbonate transport system substrate-binding protein